MAGRLGARRRQNSSARTHVDGRLWWIDFPRSSSSVARKAAIETRADCPPVRAGRVLVRRTPPFNPHTSTASAGFLAFACMAAGLATVLSSLFVLLPASFWLELIERARLAPVFGFSMAAVTFGLVASSRWIWKPWMSLTFVAVRSVLHWFRPDILATPASYTVGTPSFVVTISAACSGYEGIALMLLFGAVWLSLFRRDFRFPQSLVLIPAGMVAMWILNVVRISALILIGDAGAPAIALGGFHSQAGWIAFLCMALAFMLASQRLPWFAASPSETRSAAAQQDDATAAYLIPFLAILAAGILSSAMTGTFEWAYGIRVVGAAAAILFYRRSYSGVSWRIGWEAPAVGVLVFAIWIAAERLLFPHASALPTPPALAASSAGVRAGWILLRAIGAIVTVPIAEELAFRGYLLRRLVSTDFVSADLRRFHLIPFAVSSVVFGILHGERWIAGTIAGMLYATVARRRGSLGDATVAHATTNALIAALVLITGNWNLW
jgi:exosortase E/protease (VPEID-CTERM system)